MRRQPALQGLGHRVSDLAVNVELELLGRGVADTHGTGVQEAAQPRDLPFRQAPLTSQPIHDLHLGGIAGDTAQKPLAPGRCLLVVTQFHEGLKRHRGVTQPAEPVVPVPRPARVFGQGCRRSGDDASGRHVGQSLERDQ